MKALFISILFLFIFQTVNAQTNDEILQTLRERVEIGKTNQSIVVATIDEKGTKFTSLGQISQKPNAENADENTVFEIGSITKVFTGTLLAEAVKRGEVKLDDPISKYLPAAVKVPTRNGKEITLIDLATHTSGLPRLPSNFAPKDSQNPYADYTVEQMYDFLSKYELPRDIGSKAEYSNFGMGLLGHILSRRAGISYENLVKTRILLPLGLNDTTITLYPAQKNRMAQGHDINGEENSLWDLPTLAGAGALRSTAKDMAKFAAYNLGLEKSGLLDVFNNAHQPQRDFSQQMKIGLAWLTLQSKPDKEIVWHNGGTGGFVSFIGFIKSEKRAVVILSNTAQSVDDIGMHLLDATSPLRKIKPYVAVGENLLDEYAGNYEFANKAVFTITTEDGKLYAQLANQARLRVFAESENKFYYKVVNAKLTFNRGADGKIESLTLTQNGEQIAKRIK